MKKRIAKKIGLTGGIASGKTTVANLFSILGAPIYSSDQRAKAIIHQDANVKEKIKNAFGQESYRSDGSYNVAFIAPIVFEDKKKLALLNAIVHPAVLQDQSNWFESLETPYGIVESALLFETNTAHQFDVLIVVASDDEIRLERIQKRDGLSKKEALARLENQMPQSHKIEQAEFVIWNNGTESIIQQVLKIHESLLA